MNKKHFGIIILLVGIIALNLLFCIAKVFEIVANYNGFSIIYIISDNFLIPFIVIMSIIISGIYIIIKDAYNNLLE